MVNVAKTDPELATIIDAWHTMPAALRAAMLAMVKAVGVCP